MFEDVLPGSTFYDYIGRLAVEGTSAAIRVAEQASHAGLPLALLPPLK